MPSPSEGLEARAARPGIGDGAAKLTGRVRVEEIQRARLLAAMIEVCSEHGLTDSSVARVVASAGVSRRTFYEIFKDREECFLAALDEAIEAASRCVLDAYDLGARWPERLRTALAALLGFLDAERGLGELLVVGSLGAGPRALECRRRVLSQIATVVDEGRSHVRAGAEPPPLTAEGVVGGALSILQARMLDGERRPLLELLSPLMSTLVLPYLGAAAARREYERPTPESRLSAVRQYGDPLRGLDMRLTYRTVRVLMSVAANPGSSNREVGEAAGMSDQGQISKLLGRLERLELLSNTGLDPGKGGPNAWALTEKGRRVERAMSVKKDENGALSRSRSRR